jgi:hypothetical protein
VVFVDANRDDIVEGRNLGARLICKVLQVAPSTYYTARGHVPSARALNDVVLSSQLCGLWESNFLVYWGAQTLESCPPGRHRYWSGSDRETHETPGNEGFSAVQAGENKDC